MEPAFSGSNPDDPRSALDPLSWRRWLNLLESCYNRRRWMGHQSSKRVYDGEANKIAVSNLRFTDDPKSTLEPVVSQAVPLDTNSVISRVEADPFPQHRSTLDDQGGSILSDVRTGVPSRGRDPLLVTQGLNRVNHAVAPRGQRSRTHSHRREDRRRDCGRPCIGRCAPEQSRRLVSAELVGATDSHRHSGSQQNKRPFQHDP